METSKGGTRSKIVFALLVASIVIVAGTIAVSYHSPSTTNSSTSTTGTLTASSSTGELAYSVVRENVSVPASVTGGVSCFWDLPCAAYEGNDPVCCVTLISYQGSYYYLDQIDSGDRVYTAWLTNSTVYCTTPVSGSSPECPTGGTTESTTAGTCTDIPNLGYMYCGGSLRISAVGQANGSDWNYTVTISSDSVAQGQTVQLVANLTNIGQNITLGDWVEPYINPSVVTTNGTQVWAWNASQVQWEQTIAAGETISQVVSIPTSLLPEGSYLIEVAPISLQFPTPNGLTFTFQLSLQ